MKRTFVILIATLIVLYGKLAYEVIISHNTPLCIISGSLSEIAEEVIAIQLQGSNKHNIRYANQVRKAGNNLFLICNEIIYRFDREGALIGAVTDSETIKVSGYIIDNRKNELIVLGNEDDIHYYSFNGQLLNTKKLRNNISGEKIYSMAMHKDCIWTTEKSIVYNPDTNKTHLEVLAVQYDSSFNMIETRKVVSADLGRQRELDACFGGDFCVNEGTGNLYLYNPPLSTEHLLSDTLYLIHQARQNKDECITTYPSRMGSRFWLASCKQNSSPLENYIFCYDTHKSRAWKLSKGFDDDFHHTGCVEDLLPMDLLSRDYYFCKSGQTEEGDLSGETENLTLYIVKLRT